MKTLSPGELIYGGTQKTDLFAEEKRGLFHADDIVVNRLAAHQMGDLHAAGHLVAQLGGQALGRPPRARRSRR